MSLTPYGSSVRCSPHHGGLNNKLKYLLLLYHQATLFPLLQHGRGDCDGLLVRLVNARELAELIRPLVFLLIINVINK
jgi:hypothetical protein